jgi:hypothetical protein
MSVKSVLPLFLTAPRIKLRIGGTPVAYAIGFNINVSIDIQPVYSLGEYGPSSLEPTFYNPVTGTIQILRLTSAETIKNNLAGADAKLVASKDGSAPFTGTAASVATGSNATLSTSPTGPVLGEDQAVFGGADTISDGNSILGTVEALYTHLDPRFVLLSQLFSMELWVTSPFAASAAALIAPSSTNSSDAKTAQIIGSLGKDKLVSTKWMAISNCRLTSRNTNVALGQIVNEPVNFQGLLANPFVNGLPLFTDDAEITDGAQ